MATQDLPGPGAEARTEPTLDSPAAGRHAGQFDPNGDIARESRKLLDVGKDLAALWVERRRQRIAGRLRETSRGLRRFGDGLDEQPNMRAYTDAMADGLDEVSAQVEERDLHDFVDEARTHAQRQPMLFFAGSVAVGLVASRILRAAAERDPSR